VNNVSCNDTGCFGIMLDGVKCENNIIQIVLTAEVGDIESVLIECEEYGRLRAD